MKQQQFEAWLRNIYETQDVEISCSECFDRVSHFVEVEVSGRNVVDELPHVRQHLDQCRACRNEYEVLRDIRCLEDEGRILSLDHLKNLPG